MRQPPNRVTVVRETLEDREIGNYLPLLTAGYEVDLVTTRKQGPYRGDGLGLPIRRLRTRSDLVRPEVVARRLAQRASRYTDPDKIIGLSKALRGAHIVCVNETHLASSAQACLLRRRLVPARVVALCYENIPFRYEESALLAARKDIVRRRADAFIAMTPAAREALITEGVDTHRIFVQPLGVDADRFHPSKRSDAVRRSWGASDDTVVVLFAGRLLQEKGLLNLLLAFAACRHLPLRLVFVGRGSEEARLRRAAIGCELRERMVFIPWMDYGEMPSAVASADIFAMPSLPTPYWEEQLGFSMVEAMASAVPVLATEGASIPWVVGDGAVVVPSYDVDALAAGLCKLSENAELRARLGLAGRTRVEQVLNHEDFSAGFDVVVKRVLASDGSLSRRDGVLWSPPHP